MIKLLTIGSELSSAKKLGLDVATSFEDKFVSDFKKDVVVRWGASELYYNDSNGYSCRDFPNVINKSLVISKNCHKKSALQRLSKVVNTPKIYQGKVPAGIKVVIRPIQHAGGNDFSIQKGPLDIEYDYYATEFIETDKEFRVWFCGDAMFACRRVALTDADEKAFPCRSNWGYSYLDSIPVLLRSDSKKAIDCIGLDLGALDVLYKNGKYYFLEGNSAPSIDTNSLIRFYKENLLKLVAKKFPRLQAA